MKNQWPRYRNCLECGDRFSYNFRQPRKLRCDKVECKLKNQRARVSQYRLRLEAKTPGALKEQNRQSELRRLKNRTINKITTLISIIGKKETKIFLDKFNL